VTLDYLERPGMTLITDLKSGDSTRLLENRVAIVTGGGKGIGKGISIRMAMAGAGVVIIGNANMAMAEETCELIRRKGGRAFCLGVDLSTDGSAEKVVNFAVDHFGKIDILVNNAAYQPNRDITEYPTDLFEKVIRINLFSYMRLIMAAAPFLKDSGHGRIINISSVHGKRATGFDMAYATTKGGVTMLTREAAAAFAGYGITCNATLPGGTAIEFKTADNAGEVMDFNQSGIRVEREKKFPHPVGLTGYPSDSGNLAVFLASDLASHYNGVQVRADGGMMML